MIHVVGGHLPSGACLPQGALGIAEGTGGLLLGQQPSPHEGIGGGTGEQHVAAAPIELAGEGIEERHGPAGLRGIGVLFEARPGDVARGLLGGEHADGPAHVCCWHPGQRL